MLILAEATPGVDRRAQVAAGMRVLLRDLEDESGPSSARPTLLCIGGQSVLDSLAAEMLARALGTRELNSAEPLDANGSPATIDALDLAGIDIVIVSFLAQAWTTPAQNVDRRLRRRNPAIKIIVLAWHTRQDNEAKAVAVGADAVVVGSFGLLL